MMDYLRAIFTTPVGQSVDVTQERYALRKQEPAVATALDQLFTEDPWVEKAIKTDDLPKLERNPERIVQNSHLSLVFQFEAAGKQWLVKRNVPTPERYIGRLSKSTVAPLHLVPKWMTWALEDIEFLRPYSTRINPLRVIPVERARAAIAQAPEQFDKIALPKVFLWNRPDFQPSVAIDWRLLPVEEKMEVMSGDDTVRALAAMESNQAAELLRQLFRLNLEAMFLIDLHPFNAPLSKDGTKVVPLDFEPFGGIKDRSQPWEVPWLWDPRALGLMGIQEYCKKLEPRISELKLETTLLETAKRVAEEERARILRKYKLEYFVRYSVRTLIAVALLTQLGRLPSLWKGTATAA